MQTLGLLLLFILSCSTSIALIALALVLLNRSLGVIPLEVLPFGIGFSLALLALGNNPALVRSLLPLVLACGAALFLSQPIYVALRRRFGGESLTLMLSFAIMTSWKEGMAIATGTSPVHHPFPEWMNAHQSLNLKLIVIVISVLALVGSHLLLNFRGNLAALQLSREDSRLLTSFGISSRKYQRKVLLAAMVLVVLGSLLYIGLQQSFSIEDSYDIIVPAFAISLAQQRVRLVTILCVSILLLAATEILTRFSTASTIRAGHQGILFGAVVLIALLFRLARQSGRWQSFERKSKFVFRRTIGENHG